MRFLPNKAAGGFAEGEKIFVYQYPHLLTRAHGRLLAAFRACGHDDHVRGTTSRRRPVGQVNGSPGCLMGHETAGEDGDEQGLSRRMARGVPNRWQ